MGSMPRRARQLIPTGLPPRGRVMAACAVLILLAHLLLAQLTLGLAVAFTVTGRVSRWRLWWLTVPAAAGLVWALAIGPGARRRPDSRPGPRTSSATWPRGPAWAGWAARPGLFAGAGSWLPRQLPVALIAGAAEAALIGWLDWLRTDRIGGSAATSRRDRGGPDAPGRVR